MLKRFKFRKANRNRKKLSLNIFSNTRHDSYQSNLNKSRNWKTEYY